RSHIHRVGCWSSRSKSGIPIHWCSRVERRRWLRPARRCATHLLSLAGSSPAPELEGLRRRIDHGRPYIRNVCSRFDGLIYISRRYGLESAPSSISLSYGAPPRVHTPLACRGLDRRHESLPGVG